MNSAHIQTPATVLIVGAGATLAQHRHHRSTDRGGSVDPPLDRTFFQQASELEWKDKEITGNIHRLRELIKKSDKFHDPFDKPSYSMEQFFGDVYYEVVTGRSPTDFKVYVELLRVYCNLIACTTNPMTLLPDGPVDRLLKTEYEANRGSLGILTFNHDLVIENALCRFIEHTGHWDTKKLYGPVPLHEVTHSTGHRFPDGTGPHRNGGVEILKLHGSLNWAITVNKEIPELDELFPKEIQSLRLLPDRLVEELGLLYVYKRDQNMSNQQNFWPFIIPPIYEKGNVVGVEIMRNVWNRAREFLAGAQRLVMFGYSLPEADHMAIQLLRSAVRSRPALEVVECINPDGHVVGRICDKLECRTVGFYTDVDAYLKRRSS